MNRNKSIVRSSARSMRRIPAFRRFTLLLFEPIEATQLPSKPA